MTCTAYTPDLEGVCLACGGDEREHTPRCPTCLSPMDLVAPDPRSSTRFHPFLTCRECGQQTYTAEEATP